MRYYWRYLQYLIRSKHRKGFGVHSPFMFYFITKVIEEKLPFYRFAQLRSLRRILAKSTKEVSGKRMSAWVKEEMSEAYLQMLFRFVHALKPNTMVEMGTSIGLTSAYLATPNTKARLLTVGNDAELMKLAAMNLQKVGADHVQLFESGWNEAKNVWREVDCCDFLFFSSKFPAEYVRDVWDQGASKMTDAAVVVMADIYRDKERMDVWQELQKCEKVRVCLDLHHYGLLFFDEKLQRESYNLFYLPPLFS